MSAQKRERERERERETEKGQQQQIDMYIIRSVFINIWLKIIRAAVAWVT